MRKIKFRVWDKERQKMMIGNNQYGADEPDFDREKSSAGAFTRLWEALARIEENERYVLMQYTGLKDKNGKEIYEGDIFYLGAKNIKYLIVWEDTGLIGKQVRTSSYVGLEHWQDKIEVIGNIYENPELVE